MTATNEDTMALLFAHLSKLQGAMADKAESDAEVSRIKKLAKADGILTEDLNYLLNVLKLEDPFIELERMQRRVAMLQRVGIMPKQADLFADRRPADERDYDQGYADGITGKTADDARGADYMRGWSDGQAVLSQGIQATEKPRVSVVVDNTKADPFDDESTEELAAVH